MNKGTIFIISGPSGCGKSTLLKEVFSHLDKYFFSVSATTRAPRSGEVDGVHYHFITKEKFKDMISKDEFLEYAEYVEHSYGTPREPVETYINKGCDVFMDIEVQGERQVKEKKPEAVAIFIAPPSMEELERRLRNRSTENEQTILGRLSKAKEELSKASTYDYVIVNDDVKRASDELLDIILKEKKRTSERT